MYETGRDRKLIERGIAALERNATATEKMLAIAEQDVQAMAEVGPPVCPHCGRLNPEVTQLSTEGSGPLGDFVMAAEAHCCNRVLYAVPHGWDTAVNLDLAVALQNAAKKGGNGG